MIDHRQLLIKYILFIRYEEGIDFIDSRRSESAIGRSFSDDEWKELESLSSIGLCFECGGEITEATPHPACLDSVLSRSDLA